MTAVQPFDFDGTAVRVVTDEQGEPWFVLADLCRVLGIANASDVASRLDDDALGTTEVTDNLGRTQVARTANEAGMYEVVFLSRRPNAKAFKRWVTHEVLPAIRKTGRYGAATHPDLITRSDLARMVLEAEEERAVMAAALESAAPAVAYHERYVSNDDAATVKVWGAQFGLTERQAYNLLVEKNVVYRHHIGKRWSGSKQRTVDEYEYRARAGRVSFAWFDLRPQHNAPRHHNGQVRQTLYVRQEHALDLGRKVGVAPVGTQQELGVPA